MTARQISNSDDVIDSRDVIARIKELEGERESLADAAAETQEAVTEAGDNVTVEQAEALEAATQAVEEWDEENGDELKALKALAEEAEGYAADWPHGETLIRESYFVDYCQELLEDIGDLPKDLPGYLVIDWKATARNLRVDYTAVDFDGVTYLIR